MNNNTMNNKMDINIIKEILNIDTTDVENKTCLICWDCIGTNNWCICVHCNIVLHAHCEKTYRADKGYCKCIHCQRLGSIATKSR